MRSAIASSIPTSTTRISAHVGVRCRGRQSGARDVLVVGGARIIRAPPGVDLVSETRLVLSRWRSATSRVLADGDNRKWRVCGAGDDAPMHRLRATGSFVGFLAALVIEVAIPRPG